MGTSAEAIIAHSWMHLAPKRSFYERNALQRYKKTYIQRKRKQVFLSVFSSFIPQRAYYWFSFSFFFCKYTIF